MPPQHGPAMIEKKEIVEHVAETTELNKRQAREGLEASLTFLHDRLSDGQEIQIPPLGKIRIVTQNEGTSREKTVYRLILQKPKTEEEAALASEDTVAD